MNIITNCLFAGNQAAVSGGGIGGGAPSTITNCTFYGNSAGYSGGGMFNNAGMIECDKMRVTNSILWGNTAPQYKETGTDRGGWGGYCGTNFQYSDIDQSDYTGYNGNIRQNPQFVDVSGTNPNNWDLHLQAGSPCIDTGKQARSIPLVDMDGECGLWTAAGMAGARPIWGPMR